VSSALIQDILFQRLTDEGKDNEELALYVLAACEGSVALDRLIDGVASPVRPEATLPGVQTEAVPPTYLSSVQVRSFRGIGDDSHLPLNPGPGVTVVVGRNGSGKSSFAEGAEVAFTGTSARWLGKGSKEWLKGWRNVHGLQPPRIVVELIQQGLGPVKVERSWKDPDDLSSGHTDVVDATRKRTPLSSTGWKAALEQYRPFLSYSELGGMLEDGPGKIYQALLAGLGLDDYEEVRDRLSSAENSRSKLVDVSRKGASALAARARDAAQDHPEEARFLTAAELLEKRTRDVDAVAALATGRAIDERGLVVASLTSVEVPLSADDVASLPGELRTVAASLRRMRGRSEDLTHRLSVLLREALVYAKAAPEQGCPVCGSERALDAAWQVATAEKLEQLDKTATAARELEADARTLVHLVSASCNPTPDAVTRAAAAGLDSAVLARHCWVDWSRGAALDDPDALAAHVETHGPTLLAAIGDMAREAAEESRRRDLAWQPYALEVAQWVGGAQAAVRAKAAERHLKDAKSWVGSAIDHERQARFAPVKQQAIGFWNRISEQSNVTLQDIVLSGMGKAQRVTLKVCVDGRDAPALGVLSQGELNAMTLSLFLPRVLLDATPFGFVIVDDPVQAMDEARVDGLAHVLTEVGKHRQVVVFTHDARLPEAFERLALPHSKRRVVRGRDSRVLVSALTAPWEQRLDDADAVALTPDLPADIAGRVVPGFCRQALEAACTDNLRRRWLVRGEPHAAVEDKLAKRNLRELLALLFFEKHTDHAALPARLKKLKAAGAVDVIQDCQNGAHEGFQGDLKAMVSRTRSLCDELRRVKQP